MISSARGRVQSVKDSMIFTASAEAARADAKFPASKSSTAASPSASKSAARASMAPGHGCDAAAQPRDSVSKLRCCIGIRLGETRLRAGKPPGEIFGETGLEFSRIVADVQNHFDCIARRAVVVEVESELGQFKEDIRARCRIGGVRSEFMQNVKASFIARLCKTACSCSAGQRGVARVRQGPSLRGGDGCYGRWGRKQIGQERLQFGQRGAPVAEELPRRDAQRPLNLNCRLSGQVVTLHDLALSGWYAEQRKLDAVSQGCVARILGEAAAAPLAAQTAHDMPPQDQRVVGVHRACHQRYYCVAKRISWHF